MSWSGGVEKREGGMETEGGTTGKASGVARVVAFCGPEKTMEGSVGFQ